MAWLILELAKLTLATVPYLLFGLFTSSYSFWIGDGWPNAHSVHINWYNGQLVNWWNATVLGPPQHYQRPYLFIISSLTYINQQQDLVNSEWLPPNHPQGSDYPPLTSHVIPTIIIVPSFICSYLHNSVYSIPSWQCLHRHRDIRITKFLTIL